MIDVGKHGRLCKMSKMVPRSERYFFRGLSATNAGDIIKFAAPDSDPLLVYRVNDD